MGRILLWSLLISVSIIGLSQSLEREVDPQFACLSTIDGTHKGTNELITVYVRDAASFRHVETRITPVKGNGQQLIFVDFTAENAMGFDVEYTARAYIDPETCEVVRLVDIQ